MRALDLNGSHLGAKVRVQENGNTAEGVLSKVSHASSTIVDQSLGGEEFYSIGRQWVELEFLGSNFSITVTPDAEVWRNP